MILFVGHALAAHRPLSEMQLVKNQIEEAGYVVIVWLISPKSLRAVFPFAISDTNLALFGGLDS